MEAFMKKALLTLPFLMVLFVSAGSAQDSEPLGKVFWRGMVDDRVHLVIKADKIEHKTVSGQAKSDGVYSFTAPLPQQTVIVTVNKQKGRSKQVKVIQQPSQENDFTAIVEIYDDGGGAKEYQLEISWR